MRQILHGPQALKACGDHGDDSRVSFVAQEDAAGVPYVDKEPNMVLIEGARGGRSRLTVEKPLIIYESEGKYTPEIYDIYGY